MGGTQESDSGQPLSILAAIAVRLHGHFGVSAFPMWVVSKVIPLGGCKIAFLLRIETLVWFSLVLVFQDRISQAVLELAYVDQAGLKRRDPPVSASLVLGLKACVTAARPVSRFKNFT